MLSTGCLDKNVVKTHLTCGSLWLFRLLVICNYSKTFKFLRTFVAFAGDTLKEFSGYKVKETFQGICSRGGCSKGPR